MGVGEAKPQLCLPIGGHVRMAVIPVGDVGQTRAIRRCRWIMARSILFVRTRPLAR